MDEKSGGDPQVQIVFSGKRESWGKVAFCSTVAASPDTDALPALWLLAMFRKTGRSQQCRSTTPDISPDISDLTTPGFGIPC
jgi:hypothetical protein